MNKNKKLAIVFDLLSLVKYKTNVFKYRFYIFRIFKR